MKYRDNEVRIRSSYVDYQYQRKYDYQIVGGSCRITQLSITAGQDPNNYNRVGNSVSFGSSGSLRFKVGRKGSGGVASWWRERVSAGRCTFNDTPGKLNFAFNVDLRLSLTGGSLGSRVATIRFDDLYFGQGHAGSSNNWWFGGRHCTHIGGGKVRVEGLDVDTGLKVYMDVKRGGNGVNEYEFSNYRIADAASWMRNIGSEKLLNQIVMPGSHDAGMGETRNCAPNVGFTKALSRTQMHTIRGQLNHGARYFDIRVDYDKGALVSYHRTGTNSPNGCSGQYIDSILSDVDGFLRDHPSETVILKFSQIREYKRDPLITKRLLAERIGRFSKRLRSGSVTNLATVRLGDVRGKAIMVFDYIEHHSKEGGRYLYRDGMLGGQLAVYDEYSNTTNLERMQQDQLSKWRRVGGLGKGYLFLLSWTLTPSATSASVEGLARRANQALPSALDRYPKEYRSKPNIVYIDYVDQSVTSSIIGLNFL
ncbi:hypothetical protein ACNFG0_03840 [Pseudomonas sp. NY15372]|uniref:hypothetical protein n=1 Tax=Pseudomonas sp. NY15372 TaxID=3400356 RepID=UPI003A89365A